MEKKKFDVEFHGTNLFALVPLLLFVVFCILFFVVFKTFDMMHLCMGGYVALIIGSLLSKNWGKYWDAVATGMSSKIMNELALILLIVGMFGKLMTRGGVAQGFVWLGDKIGLSGGGFVAFTFIATCVIATATGTSIGTMFTAFPILYPSGLLLGADPVFLAGAILSGAIFGDNVGPISDTTIASASTQEYTNKPGVADVAGVVGSRMKYALVAAAAATVCFALFGGSGSAINQVLFQMPTKMGKGILVTPTYHGNLLIGPDAVNDESVDRDTHAERLLKIFKEATLTTDKLNIKQFIRSFTGVRAVSTTDDFIVEESRVPHFINVAGIQSPGITSSPAIAQMVAGILRDAGLDLREDPGFNPHRDPIITKKELKPMKEILPLLDLPLGDPERMVCRCEQVTEATILDAMHRGIPVTTIDGIKRRTRAGMGWCQGTFCRPRVAEVMSKELGYEIDPGFDIEHSGVNRIGKNEIVAYIEEHMKDE